MTAIFNVFEGGPEHVVKACAGYHLSLGDGRSILDTTGGGTSHMILGWGHQEINEAIEVQLSKFSHVDYKIWKDPNLEPLAELLTKQRTFADKVYFAGNSGAEAIEAAMKMSFLVHRALGKEAKTKFIGRLQAYHGSTSDAMSLTDRPHLMVYEPLFPQNKIFVEEHNPSRQKERDESDDCYLLRWIEQFEATILREGPEHICAFVGETIMGGLVGDVPPVDGYWRAVSEVCKKYDIHLIVDEIYCGTGTSGTYHCCEQDDIVPDFLVLGKTLCAGYAPMSAVITHAHYEELIHDNFSGRLAHTTTMQGYSIGVAAALAVQEILSSAPFLTSVRQKSLMLREKLESGLEQLPTYVETRGRGLRMSVEHNTSDNEAFSAGLKKRMYESGIYVDSKFHRTSFTPSLLISESDLECVAESFIECFREETSLITR